MQPELYTDMARLEASHFWFRARRSVLEACMDYHVSRDRSAFVLDAGCGVGTNLGFLERFGTVFGLELYHDACRHSANLCPGRLVEGRLELLPLRDNSIAIAALLDVLEHVDDQQGVLAEIVRILQPGGSLLITVPAFRHLWSGHDVIHQHRRRYCAAELRNELNMAGMHIEYLSYYNTHLYPLVAATRLLRRQRDVPASDMQPPPAWLNALLHGIFRSERHWIGRISMPFGVSLVAIAKKP